MREFLVLRPPPEQRLHVHGDDSLLRVPREHVLRLEERDHSGNGTERRRRGSPEFSATSSRQGEPG